MTNIKPYTVQKIAKSPTGQYNRIAITHMFADRIADEILPALFTLKDQELPINDPKSPIEDIKSPEEMMPLMLDGPEHIKIKRPWIDSDPHIPRSTPKKIIIPDLLIVLKYSQILVCIYLETQEKSVIESCFADIQALKREKSHVILIVPDKTYRQGLFTRIQEQYLRGFWILTVDAFIAIFKILIYENSRDLREVVLNLPTLLPKWQIFLANTTAFEIIEWTGLKPRPNPPSFEEYSVYSKNLLKSSSVSITRFCSSLLEQRRFEYIKFGIIGMGDRGIQILTKYVVVLKQKGGDIMSVAAICDHNPQAIEIAIIQAGIKELAVEKHPKIYTNLEDFLRDPNFHMVIITLPTPLDQNIADRVLQARKVPLTITKDIDVPWDDPWIH